MVFCVEGGLWSFVQADLTHGYNQPFCDDDDTKQHVLRNFMRTPKNLENVSKCKCEAFEFTGMRDSPQANTEQQHNNNRTQQ